jgi:hypothetical protein
MFFIAYYLGLSDLMNQSANLKQNNGAEYPINISSQLIPIPLEGDVRG